eukprot:286893-Pyramimonas_sp.AAC.1
MVLALAPRTLVLNMVRVSQAGSGSVSKCGSRLSAAHISFKHLQAIHGLRAAPFHNVVLA